MPDPVVTISASYGAGGSVVAPRLAARLGWPFIDRMVTAQMSTRADALASQESVSPHEPSPPGLLSSLLTGAAGAGVMMGLDPTVELQTQTDDALSPLLAGGGGVVLGRAAAVLLAGRPRTLHVRLDGPVEARIARAATIENVDVATARERQARTDRARNLFVRRLYKRDPEDQTLYNLRIDTTMLTPDAVVSILATVVDLALGTDTPEAPAEDH